MPSPAAPGRRSAPSTAPFWSTTARSFRGWGRGAWAKKPVPAPRAARPAPPRHAALAATRECLAALEPLEGAPDRPVMVQMDSGSGPEQADWRPSSTGRELQFLCSHTVHHYALIKLLLDGSGIDLGVEFGMAPSSLAYQRALR